jgi:hypothetical protein
MVACLFSGRGSTVQRAAVAKHPAARRRLTYYPPSQRTRVLERLGSDLLARQLYETALTEDLDPSAEAARFRRTPAEIKAAHDRLRYHARIVLEEWNASEARRMSTLKERATTRSEEDTP